MPRRGNRNAVKSGLYAARFSEQEIALLQELSKRPLDELSEEVAFLRLAYRLASVALALREGEEESERGVRAVGVIDALGQAGVRLAQMLKAARVLSGESSDSLAAAFAVALHEIGEELGVAG